VCSTSRDKLTNKTMSLINLPNTQPPAAQRIALDLLGTINRQIESRVQAHKGMWSDFWQNKDATPEEILEAMGTNAHLLLGSATESIRHINEVAGLAGKTAADFLEPEEIAGLRPMVGNEDGTVTLQ
jgi:hypothetical protein